MECRLCGSNDTEIIYEGPVKTGLLDGYSAKNYPVYRCNNCRTIWNNAADDYSVDYYESTEYRSRIETDSSVEEYYKNHDVDTLFKLKITGTAIFRNKVVADVGCGGGSFLDFLQGVCSEIIAIEPSEEYRKTLSKKYHTYPYASVAMSDWGEKVDVVTSFDVIEHVSDPRGFLKDSFNLLKEGGKIFIGTPTDYPILRQMLGDTFNKFIFQVHHPWILSEKIVKDMADEIGFINIKVHTIQKYGLGNLLCWLNEQKPRGHITYDFISESLDELYKKEIAASGFGEYIILEATKP